MTRRDKVYLTGKRAALLTKNQSAWAWQILASKLELCGEMDVPKFRDLLHGIRIATIAGKQATK